jgi:hypothetical protein
MIADNMILYFKDSKDFTKKFLDLINISSKIGGYKINIQNPVAFLYNNKKAENKSKE